MTIHAEAKPPKLIDKVKFLRLSINLCVNEQ